MFKKDPNDIDKIIASILSKFNLNYVSDLSEEEKVSIDIKRGEELLEPHKKSPVTNQELASLRSYYADKFRDYLGQLKNEYADKNSVEDKSELLNLIQEKAETYIGNSNKIRTYEVSHLTSGDGENS